MASTAINPITLDAKTFAAKVLEDKLRVEGPFSDGFMYALDGKELYRTATGMWEGVPITVATTADPAAGAQIATITVPAGKRWLFLEATASSVAGAAVADRYMYAIFYDDDGSTQRFRLTHSTAFTATLTRRFNLLSSGLSSTVSDQIFLPLPVGGVEMGPGMSLSLYMLNIQAADNTAAATYAYKEVDA